MADVNMAEFLMFWKNDDRTKVIGIYMEGLADPRGFFEVAREVAAVKPIVVLKSGKSEDRKFERVAAKADRMRSTTGPSGRRGSSAPGASRSFTTRCGLSTSSRFPPEGGSVC